MTGRFAPSPTGDLHLGNLRTALIAWWWARRENAAFYVRMEDLDRVTSSREHEVRQLADLAALGIDWDAEPVRQSDRFELYRDGISDLTRRGMTYKCFCTRKEILGAASAPNAPTPTDGYPGTCRDLTRAEIAERIASGRPSAIRVRGQAALIDVDDEVAGRYSGVVDDVVICRNDGIPAYNLAVVIDDATQGIDHVVRGDDLLPSTPNQIFLARQLALRVPRYAHVPLVMWSPRGLDPNSPEGDESTRVRLAKRHGSVTLPDRLALGDSPGAVVAALAASIGITLDGDSHDHDLADRYIGAFDPSTAEWTQLVVTSEQLAAPLPWLQS